MMKHKYIDHQIEFSHRKSYKRDLRGFTIIELMIATVVFSVILLLVTYGILQIGRAYTKGLTVTKTQNTARTVMDAITQDIQFYKSGSVDGGFNGGSGTYVICVGNNRYTALLGQMLDDTASVPALLFDANLVGGCSTGNPQTWPKQVGTDPVELLTANMRVAAIDIAQLGTSDLYKAHVRVVYGEDSALNNPTALDASCQGGDINQFCAVSDLTTTIHKRVN